MTIKVNQNIKGDNNTNTYIGNVDQYYSGNGNPQNFSTEVKTIMSLVCAISILSSEGEALREDTDKDIEKKLDSFPEQRKVLEKIIAELMISYGDKYEEATKQSGLDETEADKTAKFLRQKSYAVLLANNNDAVVALDKLTDFFEDYLKQNSQPPVPQYDHEAIRYYLAKQMIICNVFPNDYLS